jgi:predicted lipoprotein with Yx(FWY)xxD motif
VRPRRPLVLFVALFLSLVALLLTASAAGTSVSSSALVKVAFNKKLKKSILVDSHGITLYLFVLDHGKPTCTNDPTYHCSKVWPPLRTNGAPRAGQGVKRSLLGVVKNPEGGVQVTYNHHPLYSFHGGAGFGTADKPGEVKGQNFAGLWYVVSPQGKPIRF